MIIVIKNYDNKWVFTTLYDSYNDYNYRYNYNSLEIYL